MQPVVGTVLATEAHPPQPIGEAAPESLVDQLGRHRLQRAEVDPVDPRGRTAQQERDAADDRVLHCDGVAEVQLVELVETEGGVKRGPRRFVLGCTDP